MNPIQNLLRKMFELNEESKKNINQFYQSQRMTITDLYRAKNYADLIEKNIERLNYYLEEHRKIRPQNAQEYARSLNNISIQANMLKAAQQAMNDGIFKIKESGDIQQKISGKLLYYRKELSNLFSKVEKIIKTPWPPYSF